MPIFLEINELFTFTGEAQDSSSQQASAATAGNATEPQSQRARVPLSRLDKAPELVAFEAGREVMDVLRAAHSHMCNVLEVISSDLGKCSPEECKCI